MASMIIRPAILLIGVALLSWPALSQEGSRSAPKKTEATRKNEASEKSETAEKARKAEKSAPKPNERPAELLDPRDFPEGVTVLVPRRDSEDRASAYPEGVTVLGPDRTNPDGPRIRVRLEPGAPAPELPELEELPHPVDVEGLCGNHVESGRDIGQVEIEAVSLGGGIDPVEIADALGTDQGADRTVGDRHELAIDHSRVGVHAGVADNVDLGRGGRPE